MCSLLQHYSKTELILFQVFNCFQFWSHSNANMQVFTDDIHKCKIYQCLWMTTWNFTTWQILNIAEEINQCLLVHDRLHAQIFICICFFIEPVLLLTFQIKKIFPVDVIKNPFQCSDAGLIKLMALLEGKKKFNHCFDNLTHMHQNNSTYYDSLNAFVRLQSSEIYMYYATF